MEDYRFAIREIMGLRHLADTVLTVSEMTGPKIDGRQYYINTTYRLGSDKRTGKNDVGIRKTKGFSLSAQDIDGLIALLQRIKSGGPGGCYYDVCTRCTATDDRIVLHKKDTVDSPARCPAENSAPDGGAFVVK